MNLNDLLDKQFINLNSEATTKLEAITTIASILKENNRINDIDQFIVDVYDREATESTNLISGIAIPHCKTNTITKSSVSLIRIAEGVDWEDGKDKVHIIFLLAVSPSDVGLTHLEVISTIATLLIEEDFIELLFKTNNSTEITDFINRELEGGNE